ncbi:MAG: UDP-glucose 4-epimerase GalE [Leptospiraceae bacterium]|nr:UDP-glucose 4-epimerase GalE [Leptospiraceae bacterium]
MMKILVTGAAGYIGSHTALRLIEQGHQVVALDNLVYGHRDVLTTLGIKDYYIGDIGDPNLLRRIFQEHRFEAVMHFSAFAYVGESVTKPDIYYNNNVVRTVTLLDRCVEAGVKAFVFSSTCATYGMARSDRISEDHPQNPINPYGQSKLMVEHILRDYERAYDLRHVILRYFNAAGADPKARIGERHDPETHLIPLVLDAALGRRDSIKIFGTDYDTPDGTCIRDYIHVNDLAQAHILGLEQAINQNASAIYNLGNGNGYSVKEVIETCREVSGRPIQTEATERRAGDPPVLVAAADKARKQLGWQPEFADLESIVTHAWRFHESHFA